MAATFCQVWEQVRSVLAELDVLVAFADVAVTAPRPYVRPSLLPADGAEWGVWDGCCTGALLGEAGERPLC